MTLVVVDQGKQHFLDLIAGVGYTLRLYRNDVTDGLGEQQIQALTETAFLEADFTGYTPAALDTADWTLSGGSPATAVHLQHAFTAAADQARQDIHGYWITRDSDHGLVWFEPFNEPEPVEFEDDLIVVRPRITLRNEDNPT